MRTRSNFYPFNYSTTIPRRSNRRHIQNIVKPEFRAIENIIPMADRTMEELLQAPTKGYREAIVIPEIFAENFEIKTNLLQLVKANKFYGFERDNPHTHISNFKRVTATLKYRDVPNDAIKLMLFPYSLEGAARVCFFQNQPSTSGSLPSNTIPNPKGEMKAVTTRSGLAYEGPSIPTESPLEIIDERNTEEILDKEQSNSQEVPLKTDPTRMTFELEDRSITHPKGVAEDVFVKVGKFHFPTDFVVVDFEADPRVPLILGRSFLRIGRALIDVYREEITLRVNDESITFNLNQTMRYSSTYDDTSMNKVDVIDIACEEFVQDVLDFQYNPKSSSPTLVFDDLISENDSSKVSIVKSSSLTLTPFGESDFFLEEIEDFLNDDSIPTGIENSMYNPEGNILFLEKLLNEDPFQLPSMDLKLVEELKEKSSIEEPPELELKELPSHLEYVFLEDSNKLPVIIAKNLKVNEKEALINVLKSHKRDIVHKISDIKGIDPRFYTHKILMKDDYKPAIQSQRRVNPKIHDVIKKLVIKLLNVDMIYPISDSPWVSPIHCVPKKGDMTMVANENNELIPTRLVTGTLQRCMVSIFNDMIEKTMEVFMTIFCDRGTHFCNDQFTRVMIKYGVTHRLATAYHPQTSGQVEVSNCGLKRILERTVGENRTSWSDKLDDALWAFHTAYKTLIGCTPYKLVYGKSCHLLIELEHRACWALKHAYENSVIYKERTKKLHDSKIKNHIFNVGDQVLLFNSRLNILSGKLKTRWSGPYTITRVFPYGTIELSQPNGLNFKVNGHRVKHYFSGDIPSNVASDLHSDCGTYFCNDQFTRVMIKYDVTHRLATSYHPQTSGQVEAYENSVIYKERTKKLHDSKIKNHIFNVGYQVLLFNSRLKIFSGKLKTRWSGPFTITQVFPYGTIKLSQPSGPNFKVNGHRVKHYFGGDIQSNVAPDLHTFPMDN
nr:reverse transcriptase domain-containing protein [Tanacetum cinerariifolium]